jgi:hypothetical protein
MNDNIALFQREIFLIISKYYSGFGASTGHTFAHDPHSIHASASITNLLSPAEIQETGHSDSHAPQLIQSSLIKYAISGTPPQCFLLTWYSKQAFTILPPKYCIENNFLLNINIL